jgi:PST family polysaccharide transporter
MVRFALHIYGSFSVNYFARNMDNLLVGWRFNAQALGFYKKAYDLFALSASQSVAPIAIVAVSALSRFKPDSDQFRRNLRNILSVMAFLGMALGADLTLVGRDLIRLMLGPGWDPAGRIFMFFGPGIGIMLVYCTNFWIHLSIGRPDRQLRWVTVEFCSTVLLFLLALRWGPVGIALAWTASFWLLTIPALWYAGRPIHFGISSAIRAIWKFIVASVVAGCATVEIVRGIPATLGAYGSLAAFIHLAESSVLFVALYLGAVVLLHQGFDPVHQVVRLLREMLFLRGASARAVTGAVVVDAPTMSPSE